MRSILLLLVLSLLIACPSATADSEQCRYIRIPVFFVTDRNRVKGKDDSHVVFGRERQYRGVCRHDPHLGVAWCVVRNLEKKTPSPVWEQLGWENAKLLQEGPRRVRLTPGATYPERRTAFFDSVYAAAQKMPSPHEVDMFVPGYMSTFESGLRSAARLEYYSERPVILYSWPSKGKFTEYWSDEATIEWSQEHFDDVLETLTELSRRQPTMRLRLYAHSMGARLVLRATPVLKSSRAFDEVSIVCPDVDDGLVKHYASKYFERRGTTIVRVYESNADKMLRLSKLVHGGYARFGEDWAPMDLLVPKAPPPAAAQPGGKTDGSTALLPPPPAAEGTSTPDLTPPVKLSGSTSVSQLSLPKLPPPGPLLRRMQTIDFTDIDIGTLGHRIPVELMCSLSRYNEPSHGIELKITRPPHKHTDPNEAKPDANDGIIKVVAVNDWHYFPIINTCRKYRPRLTLWITKDWTLK